MKTVAELQAVAEKSVFMIFDEFQVVCYRCCSVAIASNMAPYVVVLAPPYRGATTMATTAY